MNKQFQIFLGRKIRAERERQGYSQESFGKAAKLHRAYVGMLERGEKNVTLGIIAKVAKVLGLQVRDLIDF